MLRPMMLPASVSTALAPADVREILLAGDNYFSGTVSLFRRSAIQALGGFDESLGSFADSLLARQLALTFGFYFVAEILGYWRIHGQNYSTTTAHRSRHAVGKACGDPRLDCAQRSVSTGL